MSASHLIVIPVVSEKAVASSSDNTYVFTVPLTANKQQIMAAVTEQYGVKVQDARVVVVKGKAVRSSRGRRANPGTAFRRDVKKAYVSLIDGESLQLHDTETK